MDVNTAMALPNGHHMANGTSYATSQSNSDPTTPRPATPVNHTRSRSLSQAEASTPSKSKWLPPLNSPTALYSHLRDTTTEVAPHPTTLSSLVRSSSFRRRFTPPHLSPVKSSPSRSRPPSPLATKTHSGSSSSGYFDFVPGCTAGTDTPMLYREPLIRRRGSISSDALMTPAEENQWLNSNSTGLPSTLPRSDSEPSWAPASAPPSTPAQAPTPPSPEAGSKLSGGDSPSTGTLERRERRRQVVRLDSFGGEGLMRKPSVRRLQAGEDEPSGFEQPLSPVEGKAQPPTPIPGSPNPMAE